MSLPIHDELWNIYGEISYTQKFVSYIHGGADYMPY